MATKKTSKKITSAISRQRELVTYSPSLMLRTNYLYDNSYKYDRQFVPFVITDSVYNIRNTLLSYASSGMLYTKTGRPVKPDDIDKYIHSVYSVSIPTNISNRAYNKGDIYAFERFSNIIPKEAQYPGDNGELNELYHNLKFEEIAKEFGKVAHKSHARKRRSAGLQSWSRRYTS